ncbi:MAG: hypothetical protein RIR44_548, partial [Bacteroidota bacterium]
MTLSADIQKIPRTYMPAGFELTNWESLEPFFKELVDRPLDSLQDLEQWLKDMSEVEAVISEDACWRQIKMTCDTTSPALEEAFNYFCLEIQPKMQPYADQLNKKFIDCPHTASLDKDSYYT